MKIIKNILFAAVIPMLYSCDYGNDNDPFVDEVCGDGEQGITVINEGENNLLFDGNLVNVQYVTGHPDGDYLHIFNTQNAPIMDFYTFGTTTGSLSTLGTNFNAIDGSYFMMNGSTYPVGNTQFYTTVVSTLSGGNQPGDVVTLELLYLSAQDNDAVAASVNMCVIIDEIVSVTDYVYITDGSNLKIVNVTNVLSPSLETAIPAPTSYYVNTANSLAYVGHFDATEPFVSFVNIANPPTATIYGSLAKSATYGRVSDVVEVENYTYISDEYRGFHKFHMASAEYSIVDGHDTMSMVKNGDDLVIIDLASGLHRIDITDPSTPLVTNTTSAPMDVDIASYPYSNGSFHSWTRTDGTYYYVANIIDQKLKKFQQTPAGFQLIDEVIIGGHATALDVSGAYAYVTMKPGPDAPLQTSYDGVKMINLNTMSVMDSKPLNNASGVVVNLNYAYVTDANALYIYDMSGGSLNLVSTFNAGYGNYIAVDN
ncbi:hypothetical protein ES676_03195 [Bizionia saleffrena]|uniref:LVIVD repeat-containing protein n=1 Tax=Bizionia saleffrena TaxID=291189 RepID=A0A8H2LIC4_9FLAO|nr:hypothetical protein [Bizionia saleffrena]TYB77312.1 hypothetical protein ES676_03195 [Bizionia saleffrena]